MIIGKTLKETNEIIKNLSFKERVDFLIKNKKALIEQKKELTWTTAKLEFTERRSKKSIEPLKTFKGKSISKETFKETIQDLDVISVTIVGNSCWVLDSHDDVHQNGCWEKTLQESAHKVFHAKDHKRGSDDKIGDPTKVYTAQVTTKELGVSSAIQSVECLLMDSDVYKALNKNIFTQYGLGMIKEHSVGMRYVRLALAINDSEKEEFKTWSENIDKIVNKEDALELGYFWLVQECKLIEISAVTRGSNSLTPTLDEAKETEEEHEEKSEPLNNTRALINNIVKAEAAESTSNKFTFLTNN